MKTTDAHVFALRNPNATTDDGQYGEVLIYTSQEKAQRDIQLMQTDSIDFYGDRCPNGPARSDAEVCVPGFAKALGFEPVPGVIYKLHLQAEVVE